MMGKLLQRGAKKLITFDTSWTDTRGGSPVAVVIPSTARVGEILCVVILFGSDAQSGQTPTGWANVGNGSGVNKWSSMYTKTCVAGDPGSTVNFVNTGSVTATICFTYKNAKSFPVVSAWLGSSGGTPQITTTKPNALVLCIWARAEFGTSIGTPAMPSGVTQRAGGNVGQYGGIILGDFVQVAQGLTPQKAITTIPANTAASVGWQIQVA